MRYSRFLLILLFGFLLVVPARAAVELGRAGHAPVVLSDVYLRDHVHYLAIEDVLAALAMKGHWDSVEHVFEIRTPRGLVRISPGIHHMRLGDEFTPLSEAPRFIDGRLRVPEEFVRGRLPLLLGEAILYRNLAPTQAAVEEESPLDRLFAVLLRKKRPERGGPVMNGVVIDPGHGGQDTGAFGAGGEKEKTIAMEVARRLEKQLKMHLGIPVHLTRTGDYGLTAPQRLEPVGRPDVDALLLLHAQAALGPQPRGVTLLVRPREEAAAGTPVAGEGESIRLARYLGEALVQNDILVTGIMRAPLLPLGRGDLPTVMVELGYLSNPEDQVLLGGAAGQDRLAEALFAGVRRFAEEQRKENTK